MKQIKLWLLPIFIASMLFIAVRPTLAQLGGSQGSLAAFLANNSVPVGKEVRDGYLRVFYEYDNGKTYVSPENLNSKHEDTNGEYIVWSSEVNGAGQIFLYHIPTETTTQLTYSGTNLKPKVSGEGKVVWERWIDDRWQVFVFDGTKVFQLTSGDLSINPDIEEDSIVYARQNQAGEWRGAEYSLTNKREKETARGFWTKFPPAPNKRQAPKPSPTPGVVSSTSTPSIEEVSPEEEEATSEGTLIDASPEPSLEPTSEPLLTPSSSPVPTADPSVEPSPTADSSQTTSTPEPSPTPPTVTEEDIRQELEATSSGQTQ